MVRNQPIDVALKTTAAQQTLAQLQAKIKEAAATGATGFGPLQSALNKLATTNFSGSGITQLPGILAQIVIGSANLEGGMQGAITSMNSFFQQVASGAGGLESLKAAFAGVGLTLDTLSGNITDAAGTIIGNINAIPPAGQQMASQMDQSLLALGASGDRARDAWGRDMQIMLVATQVFGALSQQVAINVSGAYSNLATNVTASMNRMATGFQIMLAATARLQTDSQRMATTVSGSFSNMASNTIASMNRMASGFQIIIAAFPRLTSEANRTNSAVSSAMSSMASKASSFASSMVSSMNRAGSAMASATSKAKALQSAINALKSKTITITTVYVTIRRTIFAAAGGSFVQSTPGKIGPLSVSEFGQKELVTVTPLQGPGRQPVKGLSDLLGKETEKKAKRGMAEEMERGGPEKKKEVVMMRETPIVIQVDGREIARVVNKRIFEESDALV
jgi:hypothetical protein